MQRLTRSSGTRFTLSRDELLTLPEFVLLSLFPNGLLPDAHMNAFNEDNVYPVEVSINLDLSLHYMVSPWSSSWLPPPKTLTCTVRSGIATLHARLLSHRGTVNSFKITIAKRGA